MSQSVKLILADDHALVRNSLAECLAREPGFTVAALAASAQEAVALTVEHAPDVVLMDIDMPGMLCFEAARQIARLRPRTKLIFLSAYFHDQYIDQALEVKARGYLTKSERPETVIAAIREVLLGGAFFSEEVRSRIVVDAKGARLPEPSRSRTATLSRRELEILCYFAQGMTKKLIAYKNHLSVKTVDHHISNIMQKLDIHSTVDLVRFAIREGLADA